jgi:3-oxoacyl-[acyl-carrier protein] reductase
MLDLTDKVAIVTGSTRGIGRVIALELAKAGSHVVITGTNSEAAMSVSNEICQIGRSSIALVANVSSPTDVKKLIHSTIEEFSRIDILVNNAGIVRDCLIGSMTDSQWNDVIDINLKGAFYCIREVSRHMIMQRFGRIVNVSSVIGQTGNEGQANYSASKAGLIGLTKTAAREFAKKNITVNAVAPGCIETEMSNDISRSKHESLLKSIPMNRIGSPKDVADAVLFLASDAANYITGQVIRVDGGLLM